MNIEPPPIDPALLTLIKLAVREDLGLDSKGKIIGDRTTQLAIPRTQRGVATISARQEGVIAGTFLLSAILREYRAGVDCVVLVPDGTRVTAGQAIAQLSGPLGTIFSAERVLLNFLSHLSGIASSTRRYVEVVTPVRTPTGLPPAICDTRKTTPGFRSLEKYAVRCGGGMNHRMGLYDGVMLKDNHLATLWQIHGTDKTLAELTRSIRDELPNEIMLWLEVDTLEQLKSALPGGGADIILLDNMPPPMLRAAVALRNQICPHGEPLLEASGGVSMDTIVSIASTGVERISIGALTHSAAILDLGLDVG